MKFNTLLSILFIKALLLVFVIQYAGIGLAPDEAQYWTWSQHLDWGYYSKPPGIAYQIFLGTSIFGDTELGVRIGSVIISILTALSVYLLARSCRLKEETAGFAGLMLAFSPLGIMGSLFATTDVGLVLFWTLACCPIASSLATGEKPRYYLFGAFILIGALFKWPIYLLWLFVLLLMSVYKQFRSTHYIGGLSLSLLGLFPSIIWNSQHEWATFKHVWGNMTGTKLDPGTTPLSQGNIFDFIGAQSLLMSPILFILLIMAFIALWRYRKEIWPQLIFCGGLSLCLLALYSFVAIFKKMQGNWCVFAYPTAFVFLAWYLCEWVKWGRRWGIVGIIFSLFLSVVVLSIPRIQRHNLFVSYKIPCKTNPFRHDLGWRELRSVLNDLNLSDNTMLFGDKYQMTSILSFYAPNQEQAYFLNLRGARKNQFSYWPQMPHGKNAVFVLAENSPYLKKFTREFFEEYQKLLSNYFSQVEFLGKHTLYTCYDQVSKEAIFFKCSQYNGKTPPETHSY